MKTRKKPIDNFYSGMEKLPKPRLKIKQHYHKYIFVFSFFRVFVMIFLILSKHKISWNFQQKEVHYENYQG